MLRKKGTRIQRFAKFDRNFVTNPMQYKRRGEHCFGKFGTLFRKIC